MPLRDHFRPPLDNMRHWEGLHAGWPVMMVASLRPKLPFPFFAEPLVRPRSSDEVVAASWENNFEGSVLTTNWNPPKPTFTSVTDLPAQDEYEVRVYD